MADDDTPGQSRSSKYFFPEVTALAPLLVGVLCGVAAMWIGPRHAKSEFFVVCGEILPILLLAIALEARLLRLGVPEGALIESLLDDVADSSKELDGLQERLNKIEGVPVSDALDVQRDLDKYRHDLERDRARYERFGTAFRVLRAINVAFGAGLLLYGEAKALDVLAEGSYTSSRADLIFGIVVFGFVAVVIAAVQRRPS